MLTVEQKKIIPRGSGHPQINRRNDSFFLRFKITVTMTSIYSKFKNLEFSFIVYRMYITNHKTLIFFLKDQIFFSDDGGPRFRFHIQSQTLTINRI